MPTSLDSFVAQWTDAERNGDTDQLDILLTGDFLGVGPLGFVLPKNAWLARYARGLAYKSFELEEIQSRLHGDAAVVTARQVARGALGGSPLPFEAVRVTLTAVRPAERWQMAGIHMSFIAGTPGAPPVPAMGQSANKTRPATATDTQPVVGSKT
jgi:ketosteroid isomerase-like protein